MLAGRSGADTSTVGGAYSFRRVSASNSTNFSFGKLSDRRPSAPISLTSLCLRLARQPGGSNNDRISNRSAAHPASQFRDVLPAHWAWSAIEGLMKRRIMDGAGDHRFAGERPVTRYELALALYRMVRYLEPPPHGTSAEPQQPAVWLVSNSYLPGDTMVTRSPATATVSPALLSESLAYVSDRILLHRATPEEQKEQNQ